ncbi:MAG: response regulator [Polyangiaceae bacterium]
MVVEDEALIADDIQRTLTRLGYEVPITAATGREAIHAVSERRPSVVLMDIKLRGAMDGIEAAREIRKQFDVPIVYLTSHSDEGTLERAKGSDPYGYIVKPFSERELRTSIEIALHAHETIRSTVARERWFAHALHAVEDAVVVVDARGRVAFMNVAAEALSGSSYAEAAGHALSEVLVVVDANDGRARVVSRDGRMREVERRQLTLTDARGERSGELIVLREASDLRTGREPPEADRMATIGRIASAMGHELNNPLAAVVTGSWFAQELVRDIEHHAPPEGQVSVERERITELSDALTDVQEGADRARRVVQQLRRFVVPSTRMARLVDPVKLVLDAMNAVVVDGVTITRDFATVSPVEVDEAQLTQALACLLENGIEAGKAAGHPVIDVSIRNDAAGRIEISVADRGRGVPAVIRARMFEPFVTTKTEGARLGLGLTVAEHAVREAGGELRIDDREGGGTVARMSIPPAVPPEASPERNAPRGGGDRPRVLVVDDEPALTRSVRRALERDCDVATAGGGREALDLLLGGADFDVVLTDVQMPDMTGVELHQSVAACLPAVARRFVFVTGGVVPEELRALLRDSPQLLVTKPFVPATLRAIVCSMAGNRDRTDA